MLVTAAFASTWATRFATPAQRWRAAVRSCPPKEGERQYTHRSRVGLRRHVFQSVEVPPIDGTCDTCPRQVQPGAWEVRRERADLAYFLGCVQHWFPMWCSNEEYNIRDNHEAGQFFPAGLPSEISDSRMATQCGHSLRDQNEKHARKMGRPAPPGESSITVAPLTSRATVER